MVIVLSQFSITKGKGKWPCRVQLQSKYEREEGGIPSGKSPNSSALTTSGKGGISHSSLYCHQVFPTSKTEIFTSLLRDAEFSWIYNTAISQDPLLHRTVKRQRRSMTYTEALTKISQRKKTNEHWEHKLELQAGELTAEQIGRLSGRKALLISPCSMQVCSATSRAPLPLTPSTATRPRSQGHRTHSAQWLMCRHPGAHHPPRGCHSTHRLCGSLIVSKHPGRERPDGVYVYI